MKFRLTDYEANDEQGQVTEFEVTFTECDNVVQLFHDLVNNSGLNFELEVIE